MLFPVSRESFLPFLLLSFLAGAFLAAVYDLLRIRRAAFRLPTEDAVREEGKRRGGLGGLLFRNIKRIDTLLCFLEDLLFCLFGTVVMILLDFKLYYGIPRWYAYGAAVGGFALWRGTVGRLVMSCSERVVRFLLRMLRFVKRRLILPFVGFWKRMALSLWQKEKARRALAYTEAVEKRMLAVFAAMTPDLGEEKERTEQK